MEREIPDVFNIFALGTPVGLEVRPRGGVALPGLSSNCRDEQAQRWSPRYQEQMHKWQDRSSPCERPRTYDRFYQKLPGNFQEPQTDSAISVCSSEENEKVVNSDKKKRKTKKSERQSRKDLHYSKTLTEHDVRHLERHLSMKRTIRKKIMRDLQQAFVQDPKEFTKVTRKRDINMKSLNFDRKTGTGQSEPNFLDMLRDSDDSGNGSPTRKAEHRFRSCRERRRRPALEDAGLLDPDHLNINSIRLCEPPPDYNQEEERVKEKRSFWQVLTGRRRHKK